MCGLIRTVLKTVEDTAHISSSLLGISVFNYEEYHNLFSLSLSSGDHLMTDSNHITHCIICNNTLSGRQTKYCSSICGSKQDQRNTVQAQKTRGMKRKDMLIKEHGGECISCGYKKNRSALSFHHRDPAKKSFPLDSRHLSNRTLPVIMEESDKCDLLCLNCHFELHNPTHEIL